MPNTILNVTAELDSSFYDHTITYPESQTSVRYSTTVKRKSSASEYWKRFICLGGDRSAHDSAMIHQTTSATRGGVNARNVGVVNASVNRWWIKKLKVRRPRRKNLNKLVRRGAGVTPSDDSSKLQIQGNTGASISHARRVKLCTQLKSFKSRDLHDFGTL